MTDQPVWSRKPIAPPPHIAYAHKLGRGLLTFEQHLELVKAINPAFVAQKNRMSYLSQHQARAEMNRIFGYGNWDSEVVLMRCDYEERLGDTSDPRWPKDQSKNPRVSGSGAYWIVGYEGAVRVTVRDLWGMPIATYVEHHFEESAPQPNRGEARALALTSVESYALRRALINLGDRFGLGLYNKGSMAPHGQYTVALEPGQLFQWIDQNGRPQNGASLAASFSPEQVQGDDEASMWHADEPPAPPLESPPVQQPPRPPQDQRFQQAREQIQQGNEQARQAAAPSYPTPDMQPPGTMDALKARMQGSMKLDDGAAYGPGHGEV
jgi:hypothetical protein